MTILLSGVASVACLVVAAKYSGPSMALARAIQVAAIIAVCLHAIVITASAFPWMESV